MGTINRQSAIFRYFCDHPAEIPFENEATTRYGVPHTWKENRGLKPRVFAHQDGQKQDHGLAHAR